MKCYSLFKRAAALSAILLAYQTAMSQEKLPQPSEWEVFINSVNNIERRDTFLLQTFAGLPTDNWRYTKSDKATTIDISSEKLNGAHGKTALKMPLDSKVMFEHYSIKSHKDIMININKGGKNLMVNELIKAKTYRPNKPEYSAIIIISHDNYTSSFNSTSVIDNPPGLDLITSPAAKNTANGYYLVDSVYAHGLIKSHSLFTGKGDWNDTIRWSHLPAHRHRHALIKGETTISDTIHCDNIYLGDGAINISSTGELSTNDITVYSNDNNAATLNGINSSGSINIKNSMSVIKSFPETGKWYFISFPFNVYASGIDPSFTIGDSETKDSGNYIYIQKYNGAKRANSHATSGNWEVIPKAATLNGKAIFEKNRGYLIAIDAKANRHELTFSSKPGEIAPGFAKDGAISIEANINMKESDQEHNGWFLCGNPMPYPLSFKEIEKNSDIDGYIYMYDGTGYKAYDLTSDLAIPAYSAFFVKAKQNTTLYVHHTATQQVSGKSINTKAVAYANIPEPIAIANIQKAPHISSIETKVILNGKNIHISQSPNNGIMKIYTMTGVELTSKPINAGENHISVQIPNGIYIICIKAGEFIYKKRYMISDN